MPRTAVPPLARQCPRCGGKVSYHTNLSPHSNWQELAKEPWDGENVIEDDVPAEHEPAPSGGILVEGEAQVEIKNGEPFVAAKTIHTLGNITPQPGDIVRLNGKYYELAGLTRNRDKWWLEPFDFEAWAEQSVRALPEHNGPSSDDIIALDPVNGVQVYYNPHSGETIGPKEEA